MTTSLSNRRRSFQRDERGTISILYASGLLAAVIIIGAAIDYSTAVNTRARLQASVDSAVLAAAKLGAQNPSTYLNSSSALQTAAQNYLTANGPANATISDFHACLTSGGDCTTASGEALQVGQFYAQATSTYTPIFNNVSWLPGSSSETLTSSATAGASLQWPQQLAMTLVGAKGWYYKHVTLYALPYKDGSVSSTYTSTADWIYQPTSLATASGSANKSVGTDVANGKTGLKLGDLGSGYSTISSTGLTGPTSVNLGQYADIFLVENIMQGPCPPSKLWMPGDWSAQNSNGTYLYTFPNACYTNSSSVPAVPASCAGKTGSQLTSCEAQYPPTKELIGYTVCSESELNQGSNPAYSSYNAICNPNAASTPTSSQTASNPCKNAVSGTWNNCNSSYTIPWEFVFVNYYPAQAVTNTNVFSTSVSATTMFPCGQTVGHEWEDGGSIVGTSYSSALSSATNASTNPKQDFFYSVATTCGPEPGMAANGYYSTTQTATYGAAPQLVH